MNAIDLIQISDARVIQNNHWHGSSVKRAHYQKEQKVGYRGENDGKRVSRARLYAIADAWFNRTEAKKRSAAIVLSGPKATEVATIRRYMNWVGDVFACDLEASGRGIAERDGATFVLGDVADQIRFVGNKIGFSHLDWCRPMYPEEFEACKLAARRTLKGGVFAFTVKSAQEPVGSWAACLSDNCDCRQALGWSCLDDLSQWEMLFRDRYHSGSVNGVNRHGDGSPMMTMAFVRTFGDKRLRAIARELCMVSASDGESMRRGMKEHWSRVRKYIETLLLYGLSTNEAAWLTGVPRGSVMAWKAHMTMRHSVDWEKHEKFRESFRLGEKQHASLMSDGTAFSHWKRCPGCPNCRRNDIESLHGQA